MMCVAFDSSSRTGHVFPVFCRCGKAGPGGGQARWGSEEGQGRVGKGCGIIIIIIGISSLPSGVVICLVLFFMVLFFIFKCVNSISFWVFTNP